MSAAKSARRSRGTSSNRLRRTKPTASDDALVEVLLEAERHTRAAFEDIESQVRLAEGAAGQEATSPDVAGSLKKIWATLDARRPLIGQFRVVLFGRTGAGKSTLMEALTQGTGSSISTGENDFTLSVQPRQANGLTVVDTPGIEGWGGRKSKVDLEQAAFDGLRTADLVILVFDSASQTAAEFSKVARWVIDYDKPTIAIINNKNRLWRSLTPVPAQELVDAEEKLRDHFAHVRSGLARFGLHAVPIVGINGQRAVAARCRPYLGPFPETMAALQTYPSEHLDGSSNIARLEDLISESLQASATDIRLQALSRDIRHEVSRAAKALRLEALSAQGLAAEQEVAIEAVLRLIGLGRVSDTSTVSWERELVVRGGVDLLGALEDARGTPFRIGRSSGLIHDLRIHLFEEHVGPTVRAESRKLQDTIRDSFARGTSMQSTTVQRMHEAAAEAMTRATNESLIAMNSTLDGEMALMRAKLAAPSARTSVSQMGVAQTDAIDGGVGNASSVAWRLVDAASVAALFVPVPGANFLIALGVRTVLQIALSWFGGKKADEAERQRAAALRNAVSQSHNAILEYERLLDESSINAAVEWANALAEQLVPLIESAFEERARSGRLRAGAEALDKLWRSIPDNGAGQRAINDARNRLERRYARYLSGGTRRRVAPARLMWQGADWLGEPSAAAANGSAPPDHPETQSIVAAYLSELPDEAARRWAGRGCDDVQVRIWLERARSKRLTGAVSEAAIQAKVDLDSGSARALIESLNGGGEHLLSNAICASQPWLAEFMTTGACDGNLERWPGGAAIRLLVTGPSLFGGAEEFRRFAVGPSSLLSDDTWNRTVVILTHIDEIGADPRVGPRDFADAVDRKTSEIKHLSIAAGLTAAAVMAVDAQGQYQDSTAWWAGVDELVLAVCSGLGEPAASNATALRRVLLAAETETLRLDRRLRSLVVEREALASTSSALSQSVRDAKRIDRRARAQLLRVVETVLMPRALEVVGSSRSTMGDAADQLNVWREDPDLIKRLQSFEERLMNDLAGWAESAEREGKHWELSRATSERIASPSAGASGRSKAASKLSASAAKAARSLGSRDVYYSTMKDFGVKFRPWGATKGAQAARSASKKMGYLAVALGAFNFFNDARSASQRDRLRREIVSETREAVRRFTNETLDGTDEEPGPLRQLRELVEGNGGVLEAMTGTANALESVTSEVLSVEDEIAGLRELMTDGVAVLRGEVPVERS